MRQKNFILSFQGKLQGKNREEALLIRVEADVKVKNECGLHVRPASCISKILQGCLSEVTLIYRGESVNARSIMGLMILAIPKNAKIRLIAEGIDAKRVMEQLIAAFETRFGEEG